MAKFIYYNRNPDCKKENDCVIRSISLASGLPYPTIRKKLFHTSRLLGCEKLCVCCYKHLLDDVFKYKRVNCDNMTVNDFADLHYKGTYIVRMNGHISCIINGNVYDIWDCRNHLLTDAWKVK